MDPIASKVDRVAAEVVDAAFAVHSHLGPGLLESVYEVAHELGKRGVNARRQVVLPVIYDGVRLDAGLRLDLLAEDRVIGELQAVDALAPIHTAQMLTYLKLSGHRLGLL